jgi:hypothetical protein
MNVIFTYLPIRLKEITETYLTYSISNLNKQEIKPTIFSDNDYFKNQGLEYDWVEFDVNERYKKNNLWSYPKIKVLSQVDGEFIHFDNDFIIEDLSLIKPKIDFYKLNLSHKHPIDYDKSKLFVEIFKKYSNNVIDFSELNNTSIVATSDYQKINKAFSDVCYLIENDIEYFSNKIDNVPPITLNQQYVNLFFEDINYLFDKNPEYGNIKKNGGCHMIEKNNVNKFTSKLI